MRLWQWSVIVFMALSGCATDPPQGPVTRPLAWMLWAETTYRGVLASKWTLDAAYERLAECNEHAYKAEELMSKLPSVARGDVIISYICLPDTMDPRR
jgi:hypothetical protein